MNINAQYRQGDVLVVPVDRLPSNVKEQEIKNGTITLAYGEVTGHHHSFRDLVAGKAGIRHFRDEAGGMYLSVSEPVALTHEEHTRIDFKPGNYKVINQTQYTPQGLRNVAD